MTREELYEQVWSQPMRTLAASMGISDVALAKRCKAANIPVPPRGWWAKKEAGKAVKVAPLPPLPFALANYFPAYEDVPKGRDVDQSDGGKVAVLPERPVFRDLAQVQAEIRAAVKSVKAPAALTTPHPIVARLLKQDAERKPASSSTYSFSTYGGPKFSTPVQQRRLRVLSCILTELARLGCKVSGSTHAGERFSVSVGGFWTYVFLHVEVEPATYSYRSQRSSKRAAPERLRFDIVDHDDRTPAKKTWREDKVPLDQQITEIIQGLLLQVEEDTRKWALLRYKWRCEDHELSERLSWRRRRPKPIALREKKLQPPHGLKHSSAGPTRWSEPLGSDAMLLPSAHHTQGLRKRRVVWMTGPRGLSPKPIGSILSLIGVLLRI